MFIILFILFGLFTGSFLNVCIDRLPRGESIVFPPSHCESCNHKLGVLDLIPVFSLLWLRGRCRYCGARIPFRLLVIEAVTGILFGYLYWQYGFTLELAALIIYTGMMIVIFVIDLEHQLVLNKVVYPGMIIAFILSFFRPAVAEVGTLGGGAVFDAVSPVIGINTARAVIALIGGVFGLVVMSIPYLVYPSGMGMGDIKLAALVGLMTGYPLIILALLISWITGGIIAAVLLALKIKGRKDPIPAAVFMVFAALVSLFWGPDIWRWYF